MESKKFPLVYGSAFAPEVIMDLFKKKERYRIDEEGKEWILRFEEKKIFGIDTGLIGKEKWFPLSDLNTDRLILKAALFGFLGVHRFALSEKKEGIFYLLTCGCAGVLPAIDILSYLLGNGSYVAATDGEKKERMYLKKPENKWLALIGTVLSLLISYLCMRFFYMKMFSLIGTVLLSLSEGISGEMVFPL